MKKDKDFGFGGEDNSARYSQAAGNFTKSIQTTQKTCAFIEMDLNAKKT